MPDFARHHTALPAGYQVRPGEAADCALLPVVERAADMLFDTPSVTSRGIPLPPQVLSARDHETAAAKGLLWVALQAREPVGFVHCSLIEGDFLLYQLSVHPAHGRKGLGRALTQAACAGAAERGLLPVYLSTFCDIPWNGPFYRRLGFRVLETGALKSWQQAMRAREAEVLDVSVRCFMAWDGR